MPNKTKTWSVQDYSLDVRLIPEKQRPQRKACLLLSEGTLSKVKIKLSGLVRAGVATAAMKRPNQAGSESAAASEDRYQSFSADAAARATCRRRCCLAERTKAATRKTECHSLAVAVGLFGGAFSSINLASARSALLNRDAAPQDFNAYIAVVVEIKLDRRIWLQLNGAERT